MKLSIIVPVYNVEPYLRKCVDSLIKQDYDSYEIILVDDGSTDGSGELCDEIVRANDGMSRKMNDEPEVLNEPHLQCSMSRDKSLNEGKPIIRVIHQENGGLSAARNAGLNVAKGEYVCFVDSDDYWEPNVLGGLMAQVEREKLDVLRFDYQNVRLKNEGVRELESERNYEVFEPNKTPRYIDKCNEIVDGETYLNTRMGYACYAWQFIVCKDIVNTFYEGIHFEDTEWLPRMMLKAKRVNTSRTTVYNYFWREGSITLTQGVTEKIKKNTEDLMLVIEQYKTYREQHPECKWLRNMQSSLVSGVLTTIARELYSERKEYIRRLKSMRVFPLSIADQGNTYKRRAMLTNILGPQAYCALVKMSRFAK